MWGPVRTRPCRDEGVMTREKKLPGDSESESLRQKASFRTGVSREDSAWANCPEGRFLSKAKHGPGIRAELSVQMGL